MGGRLQLVGSHREFLAGRERNRITIFGNETEPIKGRSQFRGGDWCMGAEPKWYCWEIIWISEVKMKFGI